MSELEQLQNIIDTILSTDNENRKQGEELLRQSREQDINNYIILFCKLLNGKSSFFLYILLLTLCYFSSFFLIPLFQFKKMQKAVLFFRITFIILLTL